MLNSDAPEEFTETMKPNIVRGYFQRKSWKILPPSTEPPLCIENTDFVLRNLLVMIPPQLWPRSELNFPCPHLHCHSHEKGAEVHLLQRRDLGLDGVFYDPLIALRAGLIRWRTDMSDRANHACPFLENGCNFGMENFSELKEHLLRRTNGIMLYQRVFSVFWGPIIKHYVESRESPSGGAILNRRLTNMLPRMHPTD
jgi:hypothetical protein